MKRAATALAILAAVAVAVGIAWLHDRAPSARPRSSSRADAASIADFRRWLSAEPTRQAEFAAFEAFLRERDVDDILPGWTILRRDARSVRRCTLAPFVLPPRAQWPHIVPALRLVRDVVVPAVGPVEVVSAYRDPQDNACANGATQSRHLTFDAIDLQPVRSVDVTVMFRTLCGEWRARGRARQWGLGAYFDPEKPGKSRGRFHVDAAGWRTWGYGYGHASSGCNLL